MRGQRFAEQRHGKQRRQRQLGEQTDRHDGRRQVSERVDDREVRGQLADEAEAGERHPRTRRVSGQRHPQRQAHDQQVATLPTIDSELNVSVSMLARTRSVVMR